MGLADCPEKTCFAVHAELEQEVLHGFVNEGPANGGLILSIGRSAEKGGFFALFPHVHSRQKNLMPLSGKSTDAPGLFPWEGVEFYAFVLFSNIPTKR